MIGWSERGEINYKDREEGGAIIFSLDFVCFPCIALVGECWEVLVPLTVGLTAVGCGGGWAGLLCCGLCGCFSSPILSMLLVVPGTGDICPNAT